MRLRHIADELGLDRLTHELDAAESRDVRCCHASDCLSEVLSIPGNKGRANGGGEMLIDQDG